MKTDLELKKDVEAELTWDPAVNNAAAIGVAVKNGVVTLTGHIENYMEKFAVERALRRVSGVKAIAVELDVKLSPDHRRSDTDIAAAAESALRWNTLVNDKVQISVDKGWVTLRGQVDWDYQRRSAAASVRSLTGVVGVSNEITIKPRVSPTDIQTQIGAALKRQVDREVNRMEIKVDGGKVVLRGTVNSWHERDAAQGAAWAAPGVQSVVNELQIG